MVLAIDVGNAHTTLGLIDDGRVSAHWRVSTDAHRTADEWAVLLRGLLGVALGIVFVAMPLTATVSYALITLFFLAGWAILSGVLEIVAAIRLRDEIEGEWLLAANGLITLALGIGIIVLFTVNPVVSILSMGWAIGAYALLSGLLLIILALRLRRRVQGRA